MRKVQRSFAVEYRSGRRKPDAKQNSIWGDVDLKSVARDLDEESTVHTMSENPGTETAANSDNAAADSASASTTPVDLRTDAATEDIAMADELEANDGTGVETDSGAPVETKKQRKPRAKKATAPGENAVAAVEKKRRGRKPGMVVSAKRASGQRAAGSDASERSTSGDELDDLLQLEEENKRLRKLLAEKLRSENSELRRRLKLG